jgi:hypothetical protein
MSDSLRQELQDIVAGRGVNQLQHVEAGAAP